MMSIKVGDKIHIEFTVDNIDNSGVVIARRLVVESDGSPTMHSVWEYISHKNPAIVKVIPKPRELRAGDAVEFNKKGWSQAAEASGTGTVLCIHDGLAWVNFEKLDAPISVSLQAITNNC